TVTVSLLFIGLAVGFGLGMSMLINVNKFSLHAMYRNRLIRAYLGASRERRRPNPFTGFDPGDNVPMHDLRRGLLDVDGLGDVAGFLQTLQAADDPRTRALVATLRPGTRRAIRDHVPSGPASPTLRRDLVEDLNGLLLAGWFAGEAAFRGAATAEATTARAAHG